MVAPGRCKVFISHASDDLWVAQQIAAEIRRYGAETFLDRADTAHGDDFEEAILQAEEECTELLVLLTPWSLKRPYVWMEIAFFLKARKRIVIVLYGLTPKQLSKDPNVPVGLKKLNVVELNNFSSYLEQLRKRL